jgi:predicted AlkP superfamily pyrophosphatase or phosphodiesterase
MMRFCHALLLTLASLAACAAPLPAPAPQRHAVLIVVDGLRPDAITAAPAPHLQALLDGGRATLAARAVEIPETLPGMVTMVTGLPPRRHGVTWNDERGKRLDWPTIFTRVHDAGGDSTLYFGKSKLTLLAAPGTAAVRRGPGPGNSDWSAGDSAALAAAFARDFVQRRPAFSFVHFRDPDYAGHDRGWMSEAYLAAVRQADAAAGIVLDAVDKSALAATTEVLLVADHGGEGTNHRIKDGANTWHVPLACRAHGVSPGAIAGQPTLLDVAPTVLAWLGLPPLPDAEGHAIAECLPR